MYVCTKPLSPKTSPKEYGVTRVPAGVMRVPCTAASQYWFQNHCGMCLAASSA